MSSTELEITKSSPVTVGRPHLVKKYHTNPDCQFVRDGDPEPASEFLIDWHELDHCDECQRRHGEGEWSSYKLRTLEKLGWEHGLYEEKNMKRQDLIDALRDSDLEP